MLFFTRLAAAVPSLNLAAHGEAVPGALESRATYAEWGTLQALPRCPQ